MVVSCFRTASTTALHKEGRLPASDDLFALRKNLEVYRDTFVPHILACVVGKVKMRNEKKKRCISDFVTASDEAFALLLWENGSERWQAECDGKSGKELPETKYTKNGAGAKANEGWISAGIKRHNDLIEQVLKDRAEEETGAVEQGLLEHCKTCNNKKRSGERERANGLTHAEEDIVPTIVEGSWGQIGFDMEEAKKAHTHPV